MMRKTIPAASGVVLLSVTPALAHISATHVTGFLNGIFHPLTGIDHIIAMVAVGLYAANLGGRNMWLVPSAFVGTMMVGGALGFAGLPLPYVEHAIGISVVAMSLAIAAGVRLPTLPSMALVALFALFHGHAHGAEGSALASFLPFAAGFVISTASLHLAGIGLGLGFGALGEVRSLRIQRLAGTVGALAGVAILAGAL